MLRLIDLAVARGARTLYRNVSLIAPPGERVGLIGANGSGKTTLFAAILGDLGVDAGTIEAPPRARVAHVAQDIDASEQPAIDYVLEGYAPLVIARAELAAAETHPDPMQLAHAHAALADLNEGAISASAKAVMHGLGFAESDGARAVQSFSGGWRNRLALARALLRPADLLLLDEPTNHLDLDSVVWLESWLRRQPATVLVISHDREFLDRICETTWHIAETAIKRYAGNYTAFESAFFEQQRQQDAAARQYERTAAHLQSFVDRFRAQATKARQAQSRLKMLERLTAIEPIRARREWRFEFPKPLKLPESMLDADEVALGYGDRSVLNNVRFSVRSGDRIGILGVNGAGKSTLVKAIAGDLSAQHGELRRGAGLAIGYFAQHQLDQLRGDETPLQHLRRLAPEAREQQLREFLGTYRFSGEFATSVVGPMSGGEKARCALALLAWKRPNLLLLDEPTNHLDIETREALTVALSSYEGALILVSHDRHLLRATTDQLWLVHDGSVASFEGDLDDYSALILASRRESPSRKETNGRAERGGRKQTVGGRQRTSSARKPLLNKLAAVETELALVSDELRELDARLSNPDFYHSGAPDEVAAVLKRRGELAGKVDSLESRWLQIQTQLEATPDTSAQAAA
ncbi:MAG: ATP-binding cassette domain-containing protein [Pseudomonadota bacterium]|nr:ATP-binding cassette domain-containing protein [Pseudomonadota bacterium]